MNPSCSFILSFQLLFFIFFFNFLIIFLIFNLLSASVVSDDILGMHVIST